MTMIDSRTLLPDERSSIGLSSDFKPICTHAKPVLRSFDDGQGWFINCQTSEFHLSSRYNRVVSPHQSDFYKSFTYPFVMYQSLIGESTARFTGFATKTVEFVNGTTLIANCWYEIREPDVRDKIRQWVREAHYERLIPSEECYVDEISQIGTVKTFPIRNEGGGVVIVSCTIDNKVIMTKQFRPGPEKIFLELPGGYMEEGEEPIDAAKRELLEETGYSGELQMIGIERPSAYSNEEVHCFLAKNCKQVAEPHRDSGEFMEVVRIEIHELKRIVDHGEMTAAGAAHRFLRLVKIV